MNEQTQDSFDLFVDDFIKTESETGTSQTMFRKIDGNTTFKDLEYQTTEQIAPVEIKEEIIKCEMPKIEECSDWSTKSDQATVSENVQILSKTIKQELESTSDVKVTCIKQEVSEYIQPKTESVVSELLTSECDLSTLKIENSEYHDNYLGHSRKTLNNTSILKKKRRRYACPICQNNFPSSKSRSTHIDGHFKKRYAVCEFCGRLMKKIEFFQHFFIHEVKNRVKNHFAGKSLKCNISSKKLKQKNYVDDKSFKCSTFKLKYKLRKHLLIHGAEKTFKCDICSKEFTRKSNLRQHLIIHGAEKPFKCDICSKRFKRNFDVQQHLIIHSAEKLFQCNICSKGFNRIYCLQQHLLIHNAEKLLQCNICSKGFNRNYCLQRHLLTHSAEKPFKCDICSKCFNEKSSLQKHLKIHSGEKLFKCDICFKCFTHKSHVRQHLIIHSAEKPFKCDICSKRFKDKFYLKRHLTRHTNKNL